MTKETKISVWIDHETERPAVIVSVDDESSSTTLRTYRVSAHMTAAKAFARAEARRRGIQAVIETPDRSGQWATL